MPLWTRLSVRYLFQAHRRNRLLGAAVAASTFLLILSMGLLQGVADRVVEVSSVLGGGEVHILGYLKSRRSFGSFTIADRDRVVALAKQVEPQAFVDDRVRGFTGIFSDNAETTCIFYYGVDIATDTELASVLVPATEREYLDGGADVVRGDIQRLRDKNSLVIFAEQARKLGIGVGDKVTLRVTAAQGIESAVDVTIVAVARDIPDFSNFFCYSDKETAHQLMTLKPEQTTLVSVRGSTSGSEDMAARLRDAFSRDQWTLVLPRSTQAVFKLWDSWSESWLGQRLEIGPWYNEMWWMDWRVKASQTILVMLMTMLCVVVGLGAVSATTVAVRSRTVEIGTLRALGVSPGQVVGMVLLETLLLAIAAVGIGLVLGMVTVALVNGAHIQLTGDTARYVLFGDVLHLAIAAKRLLTVLAVMVLITVAAALQPAFRASRIGPTEAMRDSY